MSGLNIDGSLADIPAQCGREVTPYTDHPKNSCLDIPLPEFRLNGFVSAAFRLNRPDRQQNAGRADQYGGGDKSRKRVDNDFFRPNKDIHKTKVPRVKGKPHLKALPSTHRCRFGFAGTVAEATVWFTVELGQRTVSGKFTVKLG